MLMATGVAPLEHKNLHAPSTILFLLGIAFLAGGLAIVFRTNERVTLALVVVPASFLVVGIWIAFFGDPDQFSGRIFLLSRDNNVTLSRLAFGLGAVLVLALLALALRHLIRALAGLKPAKGPGDASPEELEALDSQRYCRLSPSKGGRFGLISSKSVGSPACTQPTTQSDAATQGIR